MDDQGDHSAACARHLGDEDAAIREDMRAHRATEVPPEAITGDPFTCRHVVMDEAVGARWGFEDCLGCGKRFPMRDDCFDPTERDEP